MIARYDTKTIVIAIAALIVADGRLQPFDGDLDDYRDWLFRTKLGVKDTAAGSENAAASPNQSAPPPEIRKEAPAQPAVTPPAADRRGQKRKEAAERQRLSAARKPFELRLKRLDEQLAKLTAQKSAIDAQLTDPMLYGEDKKDVLKALVLDQAYLARELAQLEAEWLALHEQLEATT